MNDRANTKKVFVKTYGCQMNVYDTERMTESLAPHGYEPTDNQDDADMIILNTCHIREKAAEKVYSELGRIRPLKEKRKADGSELVVGVAGCVAQAEGREILMRAPVVDMVFGPQSYHKLPELVERAKVSRGIVETDFSDDDKFQSLPSRQVATKPLTGGAVSAFLTVQEGCDKFCTFCVVPYTRGAEVSRPVAAIVEEARQLAGRGVREITLLGQNVNGYHGEGADGQDCSLADLLYTLAEVDGVERLRFTTSHPKDMDDALIRAHRDLPQLMPYLHLPVQSGSNAILKGMNRKHDRDSYMRLIDRIRDFRPDLALSGDFIVGFPGESDQDFEDTMDLIRQVNYAQAYSFKYSPRPGTPAADKGEQVEEAVKSARLQELQALLKVQQQAFNQDQVGKTMPILFERKGRMDGQLMGRSPYLQSVQVDAPEHMMGQIVDVNIFQAGQNSLFGTLASNRTQGAA